MDCILGNNNALVLNILIFIIVLWLYNIMSLCYLERERDKGVERERDKKIREL